MRAHRDHALQERGADVGMRGRLARQRRPCGRLRGRPAARPLALIAPGGSAPACSAVCTVTTSDLQQSIPKPDDHMTDLD